MSLSLVSLSCVTVKCHCLLSLSCVTVRARNLATRWELIFPSCSHSQVGNAIFYSRSLYREWIIIVGNGERERRTKVSTLSQQTLLDASTASNRVNRSIPTHNFVWCRGVLYKRYYVTRPRVGAENLFMQNWTSAPFSTSLVGYISFMKGFRRSQVPAAKMKNANYFQSIGNLVPQLPCMSSSK